MKLCRINFQVDKRELLKNLKEGERGENDYSNPLWKGRSIGPRDRTNSGFIPKEKMSQEQLRIVQRFEEILESPVKAIYTTQRPNKELFWHTDPEELKCAINFVIFGNESPVTFEDGDFTYDCALLDVSKVHMVRSQPVKRILFKLCIEELTFEETREKIICNGLTF